MPSHTINILGISAYYHDSAASLVRDGKIIDDSVLGPRPPTEASKLLQLRHDETVP